MDPSQDWLLRMITTLTQSLASHAIKGSRVEIPEPTNSVGDDDMLPEILKEMVNAGQIDDAENLLFRCIENYPLAENYAIGLDFYERLAHYNDAELKKVGWSRQEIKDGICDLHQLIFNEPLQLTEEE